MSKPQKFPRITTPVGTVLWAAVDKPRLKYKSKDEYEYTLTLRFNAKEGEALEKELTPLAEKAKEEESAKDKAVRKYTLKTPLSKELDEDGEETGAYLLKLKQRAQIKSQKTNEVYNLTIGVFDAQKNQLHGCKIGKGSKVRAQFEAVPMVMEGRSWVGLTSRLKAVQVLELVEYGSGVSADGFEKEDGYTAPAGAEEESAPANASRGGDSEDPHNF